MDALGPYHITGELGRGAMGVVYRARRETLDVDVALKVITASGAGSDELRARFAREARAAAALAGHPNVVGVHDFGEDNGRLYLAMELIEGQSLEQLIGGHGAGGGELTLTEAARLVAQAARGVHHAHDHGVLHRDLKPANILVRPDGQARVTDFGLARMQAADSETRRLTNSGVLLGTPGYMAPEQITSLDADARADIYGLGATLFEAVAGRTPFAGEPGAGTSALALMQRAINQDAPLLRAVVPDCPRALEAIVARCLANRPEHRYETAAELADDLERFAGGRPVQAEGAVRLLARQAGLRRAGRVLIGIGLLVAVPSAMVGAWLWSVGSQADSTTHLQDARDATDLQERAAQAEAAWAALNLRTAHDLRLLIDRFHGAPISDADGIAAARRIHAAADAVAAEQPQSRLPAAWNAQALLLAGHIADGLAAARALAADGADPLADVVLARMLFAVWLGSVDLPTAWLTGGEFRVGQFDEKPEYVALREEATAALTRAAAHPIWSLLTRGRELQAFGDAARACGEGRYAAAISGLRELQDHSTLGLQARALQAAAHFLAEDVGAATTIWEELGRRGWVRMAMLAGTMRLAHARRDGADVAIRERELTAALQMFRLAGTPQTTNSRYLHQLGIVQLDLALTERDRGRDASAAFREAIATLDDALDRARGRAPDGGDQRGAVLYSRGKAYAALGEMRREAGGDGLPEMERAMHDHREAVQLRPTDLNCRAALGSSALARGSTRTERGADGGADALLARDCFTQVLQVYPAFHGTLHNRAQAELVLTDLAGRTGGDAGPHWSALFDDLNEARRLAPETPLYAGTRSRAYLQRAERFSNAPEDFEAAERDATAAIALEQSNPAWHLQRGDCRAAYAAQRMRAREDAHELLAGAVEDYRESLRLRPGWFMPMLNMGAALVGLAQGASRAGENAAPILEEAAQASAGAAQAAPTNWRAHAMHGRVLHLLGRLDEALAAYDAGLKLAPGNPSLLQVRGALLAQLRRK